jgi:hypothetical protein
LAVIHKNQAWADSEKPMPPHLAQVAIINQLRRSAQRQLSIPVSCSRHVAIELPLELPAMRQRAPPISDRAHRREREIADDHLGQFRPEDSRGLRLIETVCATTSLTRESLVALAKAFGWLSGIPFPRDYTRRRALVIKWFDDNADALQPFGDAMTVEIEPVGAPEARQRE